MENAKSAGKTEQIKMPKNIRQIGNLGPHNKAVYVEDYVMTYVKQLSSRDYAGCKVAVLLGYYIRTEESKNLFIKGAVEMADLDFGNETSFSDEAWTSVYENIKKYFTDVEIVGWVLIGTEFFLESDEKIRKFHVENFKGSDKVLLKLDSMEKEETFYFFENNHLAKQNGYYIYYEKNDEMQNYMVDNKEVVSEEQDYNDETTRKIRTIIKEKKEPRDERNVIRLLYAASTALAVVVLIIAAALLNNYGQLKSMETALNAISASLSKDDGQSQVALETEGKDAVSSKETADQGEKSTELTASNGNGNNGDISNTEEESQDVKGAETAKAEDVTKDEETSDAGGTAKGAETAKANTTDDTTQVETVPGNVSKENTKEVSEQKDVADNSGSTGSDTKAETSKAAESKSTVTQKADNTKSTDKASKEASAEVKYYVVQKGDSLAAICFRLYNSAKYIDTIKKLNGIEDENKILVGQKLIVP